MKHSTTKKAVNMFRRFHNFDPDRVIRIKAPNGYPKTLVALGYLKDIVYFSNKDINNEGIKDENAYIHKFEHETILATDPDGKGLYILNPQMRVKREGIVK